MKELNEELNHVRADALRREEKQEKKIKKIMRRSTFAAGIGIGLFFLKFLVIPMLGITDNEAAIKVISLFSLYLIFYGMLLILTFVFKRNLVIKADMVMTWIITPLMLAKLAMDIM